MAKSTRGIVSQTPGRLRELREAAELTTAELGELAGVTQSAISAIENANRAPSWHTICKIADALGVTTDELRKPRGSPIPGKKDPKNLRKNRAK